MDGNQVDAFKYPHHKIRGTRTHDALWREVQEPAPESPPFDDR